MKEKLKTETHYSTTVRVNGEYENIDIVQEENTVDRNAIKVKFFEERWRTPKDTIELLEKVIIVVRENFLTMSSTEKKEGKIRK